jgi:PAS domain S-box-containing protein
MIEEKCFRLLNELTALFQNKHMPIPEVLNKMTSLLPSGWQCPDTIAARIIYDGMEFTTANYVAGPLKQSAEFMSGGNRCSIEVAYVGESSNKSPGPFLPEEERLINHIAAILKLYLDSRKGTEVLIKSEQNLKLLTANVPAIIFKGYLDWSVDLFDDKVEEITGYPREVFDSRQLKWSDILVEEDAKSFKEIFARALKSRTACVREFRIKTREGEIKWIQDRSSIVFHEDGKVESIDGIFFDITERKQVEENLRESQRMLQLVMDTIPVRVFWKDLNLNYLGCNHPFALDAGLKSPEEIIGRNDFDLGWLEQAELYRSDDRSVMQTGCPKLGYEEPQTMPDGGRIWLRTNKVPLFDAEGRIKGVLGTYEDITKSREMEEMLRASESKYRIVADNTNDWEYWVSAEGRFLYTSPSCRRITGYQAREFEADTDLLCRIVHQDDLAKFEEHLNQDQTTAAQSQLEFRIIHRDGRIRWIGHVCQAVFDSDGRFAGRRGSNRDITERKHTEQALQESTEKLKLFAYSVAHDLKSPAIGIYGLTNRLNKVARDILDERCRTYCDQILKASEHIASLVDKINVYIATKEAPLSLEAVNIGEVFQMLQDEFSARLNIRQIDWIKPDTAVEIRADRLYMLRVFRNFLDNSLKYGGERLTKIWTGYEASEDFHIFSFSDNGKGFQEGDSEKIFEAFQRDKTSRGIEGAGLGLTIVKEIAEQHGGRVWVERKEDGITFFFSISKYLHGRSTPGGPSSISVRQ